MYMYETLTFLALMMPSKTARQVYRTPTPTTFPRESPSLGFTVPNPMATMMSSMRERALFTAETSSANMIKPEAGEEEGNV